MKVTKFNIRICPCSSMQSQSFDFRLNLNLAKFVFSNRLFFYHGSDRDGFGYLS